MVNFHWTKSWPYKWARLYTDSYILGEIIFSREIRLKKSMIYNLWNFNSIKIGLPQGGGAKLVFPWIGYISYSLKCLWEIGFPIYPIECFFGNTHSPWKWFPEALKWNIWSPRKHIQWQWFNSRKNLVASTQLCKFLSQSVHENCAFFCAPLRPSPSTRFHARISDHDS